MKLLGNLKNLLSSRITTGRGVIDDLARRIARDEVDVAKDPAQLEKALVNLAVPEHLGGLESRVDLVKRYDQLADESAGLEDAERRLAAAAVRESKAANDWQARCVARRDEAIQLANARFDLEHEVRTRRQATAEKHALELEHRELLNAKAINLDEFTLIGGGAVIRISDPLAEIYYVTPALLAREAHRRERIFHVALQQAVDRHRTAVDAWLLTLRRNMDGQPIDNGKMPTLEDVSWRRIVSEGLCDELARAADDDAAFSSGARWR